MCRSEGSQCGVNTLALHTLPLRRGLDSRSGPAGLHHALHHVEASAADGLILHDGEVAQEVLVAQVRGIAIAVLVDGPLAGRGEGVGGRERVGARERVRLRCVCATLVRCRCAVAACVQCMQRVRNA